MKEDEKKEILKAVIDGRITPNEASVKLKIPIKQLWNLIDKWQIGRRVLNDQDIQLLRRIQKENVVLIERIIDESRPEEVVVTEERFRYQPSNYRPQRNGGSRKEECTGDTYAA